MKKPVIILLAGGVGKRFKPLITNKLLFPFMGKPLIQHVLEIIEKSGGKRVIIVTSKETENWLQNYRSNKLEISSRVQTEPRGMGNAVLTVKELIKNDPILIMNADDLINQSFFYRILNEPVGDGFLVGKKVDRYYPAGYLQIAGKRVSGIVEKPRKDKIPSNFINLVFHSIANADEFIAHLQKLPATDDHYEKALSLLLKEKNLRYLPYTDYWVKLNYPHTVIDMVEVFLKYFLPKKIAKSAKISQKAVIDGAVCVEDGAIIEDYAVIKGPAYIGKKVVIGNHTLVRQSLIEKDCIIGYGSEIARSYIGPGCQLHHNFVGDSVLESNINPSWGTTFANLRIDKKPIKLKLIDNTITTDRIKLGAIVGKSAFLGVNCAVMPGVTIGAFAKIFPQRVINKPVGEGEIVR